MLRSSLGFHTLTFILELDGKEARQLVRAFRKHSQEEKGFRAYVEDSNKLTISLGHGVVPIKVFRATYYPEDRGIKWLIRNNEWSRDFKSYFAEVTVNPKILGGISDYVTAATFDDMEAAITNFDLEAQRISPLLRHFGSYRLKRIDYCVNFDLQDFMADPDPELVMQLIRRGNIPSDYKEWGEYDDTSHRKRSDPASFYLTNDSLNINCYSKSIQLQRRSEERVKNGFSSIPQATLDAARNIIRFEVQCKYRKLYSLSNRAKVAGDTDTCKSLLSADACFSIIDSYFRKVIGRGDWYSLQTAIRKVEACNFNRQKEKRLIDALQQVNQSRSVAKAKASFQGRELEIFNATLKELSCLGINPVTIPKEWGVKRLPDLLCAFYDKRAEEKNDLLEKDFFIKDFEAYVKEFGLPSDKGNYRKHKNR